MGSEGTRVRNRRSLFGSIFSSVINIAEDVYNTTVSVTKKTLTSVAVSAIGSQITPENVSCFFAVIQNEEKFEDLMVKLLKTIYTAICVRYITPVIFMVFMFGVSMSALYYNGILHECDRYVTKLLDILSKFMVNNLISLIRRIRRMLRLGRALKGNGKVTMLPLSYHLRSAYTEQPKETFNTVDILNDPVKALFGAM